MGPVARTLQLLQALAEAAEPLSLTQLATQLDLPSSTVHRLLKLLRERGFVEADPESRRYRVGWEFFRVGALVAARQPLNEMARPVLAELTAKCNENSQLGIYRPDERCMMFVEQARSTHHLSFSIPMYSPQPLLWGCSGRVIVAHLADPVVRELLEQAGPAPASGAPPPDPDQYLTELRRIRAEGWDTTNAEKIANSVGFAAPVFNANTVVGSISITIPTLRYHSYQQAQYAELVMDAARSLSHSLGYLPTSA
ncbi:IclR family transcriptional regulator [Nocardia sp. CA-129566]|uniref:IclR family transcriptional regulator n=1 Tax=Nocardia sp. CA-129566 TaxID=3239976 RepID=UPI003D96C737